MEEQPMETDQFEDFLNRKNINAKSLLEGEPELYRKWEKLFDLVHEDSFVLQQKFYINPIRRKYPILKP